MFYIVDYDIRTVGSHEEVEVNLETDLRLNDTTGIFAFMESCRNLVSDLHIPSTVKSFDSYAICRIEMVITTEMMRLSLNLTPTKTDLYNGSTSIWEDMQKRVARGYF